MKRSQYVVRLLAGFLVVVGLVFWSGCDSTGEMSPAQGQFTLRLTDAPASLDSAVVTVERVDLVSEDAEDEENDDDGDDGDESEIITLTDSTRQIDLLQLQNGVTTTLASVTVPEGTYTQLRFILGSENYVVVDGVRQSLQVPSAQQSGIKIILPEVEIQNDGDRLEVTLDFDVEESFVQKGTGEYLFKPTIKVKHVLVNGESIETVEVNGAVSAATADSVSVDSISFAVTENTEFDGENGASSPADLQAGQRVELEGTIVDDGSLRAREIDTEDDGDVERSITAPIEALGDSTFTTLGVTLHVTSETEFDADGQGFDALEVGDRVEVGYEFQEGRRVAREIEWEDDD